MYTGRDGGGGSAHGPAHTNRTEAYIMKHIKVISKPCLKESVRHGGCGECQASCQSACKTSCTVANQACAQKKARE